MTKHTLICGDVMNVLPTLPRYKCLIADPPDNLGLDYLGSCDDDMEPQAYYKWLRSLVYTCTRKADISWISFNAKYLLDMGAIVGSLPPFDGTYRVFVQTFTFGQNNRKDFGNGFRPILRIMWNGVETYPEAVKVESDRQKAGDKRAAPGGKVPLDVWDFPRITGNCKERRPWHPTQLREAMIRRMVDYGTKAGDTVLDLFSGTGTVIRACKGHRDTESVEMSGFYCKKIAEEHGISVLLPR